MDSPLLLMEFDRLTILESKGEKDESVSYQAVENKNIVTM